MTVDPCRVAYLGLSFDRLTTEDLVRVLADRDPRAPFGYVVTPNVDHLVRLHDGRGDDREMIWDAYRDADWCLCDSRIIALIARRDGVALTVTPGSDLTAALFAQAIALGELVCLVGGDEETLAALRERFAMLEIVQHRPPRQLRSRPEAIEAAARFAVDTGARFTFIAVGSPQQELVAAAIRRLGGGVGVGLCIGASIDFVTGRERRAPPLVQRLSMEWAYRLVRDPARLWRRYLVTGPRIFRIARRRRP